MSLSFVLNHHGGCLNGSMNNEKAIAKKESDAKRQAKKSCKPTDSRVVTGMEKYNAGKGDKIRLKGWYDKETTERLAEIFGKKKKEEETD